MVVSLIFVIMSVMRRTSTIYKLLYIGSVPYLSPSHLLYAIFHSYLMGIFPKEL